MCWICFRHLLCYSCLQYSLSWMSWWHNHNSVQNQILTETCRDRVVKLWFWTSSQTQYENSLRACILPSSSVRACMCVCPLIVTLDCSKTATYWDGVGTAVAQAAYVMRHFFSLSLSPSISVCLHSEKIRWCRNAWDYREAWLRVYVAPQAVDGKRWDLHVRLDARSVVFVWNREGCAKLHIFRIN